ncbi:fibronectin type III domain-containing protein 7, partial [Austrofundulus limnaeus]|uniref:Fibronectin type III domain-containing protein 7 n=1 Tax=Austrofundulus limnaeus TaxID=52670 RepID=A0A2I4AL92_AUSLI
MPTNVKASLRCNSNSAAVTWEPASGALAYVAVGVTTDGRYQTKCNNTMTYCDLSNLQCGQTYNVSVFGYDDSCSGMESDKAFVRTAPCMPQNVSVESRCAEGAMVVSWSPNPDAQYFHVAAVSNTGARLYCNSSSTKCTINNLPCGQSYNITVLSVRDACESKPSAVAKTSSGKLQSTAKFTVQKLYLFIWNGIINFVHVYQETRLLSIFRMKMNHKGISERFDYILL